MQEQDKERLEHFLRISALTSDISFSCRGSNTSDLALDWLSGDTEKLFGYTPEEILAEKCWRFLVVDKDLPVFAENVTGLAPGERSSCELRIRQKNAGVVWIGCRTACFADPASPGGRILSGALVDISEKIQAETSHKLNEARLECLLRINQHPVNNIRELLDYTLNEAITLTGSKIGYILLYDEIRNQCILNSWSREVMQQCTIDQPQTVFSLEDTGLWGEAVKQRRAIVVNDYSAPDPCKKGIPPGHAPLSTYLTLPVFSDGHIVAVVAVANKEEPYNSGDIRQLNLMMDAVWKIVERKRAEEALRASEAQYRLIVQTAREGIWSMDEKWLTTFVNPQMAAMLGYGVEEMMATPFADYIVEEELADHALRVKVRHQGKSEQYERRFRHKDGHSVLTQISAIPVMDDRGQLTGSFGMFTDITALKKAEEEKKLLTAQLQQAQKMEAIGTLAGGIAHDFNNILGAIIGYAEMIRDDCPPDSAIFRDIDQVLIAGTRAKELVKQILAFSRQAKADQIPLHPALILQEAIKLLRASLPTTITIEQDIDPSPVILADPTQIHQIIMNLCTNAYHAMEMNGGTLTLSLQRISQTVAVRDGAGVDQAGEYMQLSVRDSGEGIPPRIRDKMFDPFFTTKEVGKGTGMGLATVYGIVNSYGGSIVCDSTPGKGTVFTVTLPIIAEPALPQGEAGEMSVWGKEHILLVDDEEILLEMGKVMLERLGYRVTALSSSLEALETFQQDTERFDLVITDQTMPGMTGTDLSRRILQIRPGMPIILCTGYSTLISAEKAASMGIRGFAMKPLARKDIAAIIRKAVG
jgi:PAS domain S-box-containing protein